VSRLAFIAVPQDLPSSVLQSGSGEQLIDSLEGRWGGKTSGHGQIIGGGLKSGGDVADSY
jgi:hypothetical protein